ncbi:monosaccharide ABC transporter substrate-binding protein (CUT2 family) [Antricoccus suffuscus]|uniref:Monosaccharide ABC transporter substrate-binding protein (CUT2 family) n=1 Tax=Antricoccus suffuscus TaxID=1629062 RepID=A0A2T0ZEK2_9ACTN|nr:substrate-binding domain-containing protein [Antricoccus suffuscus]PRZ34776.1 monosaccharide ABC transporter substrate-binding protein (CUT2 family) [Antricoccus suffuscus]
MLGHTKTRIAAVVATLALAVLTGCSSTSNSAGSSTGVDTSNGPSLKDLASNEQKLPDLSPVKTEAGKNVWIVSCSLEAVGCAGLAGDIKSIMEDHLKWNVTMFDGKLTPATYSAGINQAIVAHAAAIVLVAIDCSSVKTSLQKAKQAGIQVVSVAGFDCPDPSQGGGESLFTSADLGGSPGKQFGASGTALADYAAAQSKGKGKIVVATEPDFQVVVVELEEFKKELAKVCPDCTIAAEAPALGADLANGSAAAKLNSIVLQHPEANLLVALQDSQLPYVTNAMRTSTIKLPIIASGGTEADIEMIKNGTIEGVMANDTALSAWLVADTTARLMAGAPTIQIDPVSTLVDKDRNLPASGPYVINTDYQAAFPKAWGVS